MDEEEPSERRKLLIVSDLHLGRDCNDITGFKHFTRPHPEFDQAFIDLLDHYTSGKEKEWRFIFNGDFIDFIEIVVVPKEGPLDLTMSFEVTDEEREFGLGTEPERCLVKLEKTFEYHEALFARLAQFIRYGGEVVLIRGNHDAELHWRKVQRVFRRHMAGLAFRDEQLDVDDTIELHNDFQTRLTFLPWFYTEPGRLWVEHGHQYDVYCSFERQLYPVSPTNPHRIDTPLAAFTMRYFVNLVNDYAAHHADVWSSKDYLNWIKNKGVSGTIYVLKAVLSTGFRLLRYAARVTYGQVRRYERQHEKRLEAEAERFDMPLEKLRAVDSMRHVPVNRNLSELARLLFLDRIGLAVGSIALVFLILLVVDSTWIELLGIVLTAILAWRVNKMMVPWRFLLPGPKMAQEARRIAKLVGVPTVVMGHSHARRLSDLGKGRRYINTGCWLPPFTESDHVDAKEPCTCRLSHLVVEDDEVQLRVFCKADGSVRIADVEETKVSAGDRESDLTPGGATTSLPSGPETSR